MGYGDIILWTNSKQYHTGKITQCKSKWFFIFFHIELMVILGIIFCIQSFIQLLPDVAHALAYSWTPAFKFKFYFTQLTYICLYLDMSRTKDSFEISPHTRKPGQYTVALGIRFLKSSCYSSVCAVTLNQRPMVMQTALNLWWLHLQHLD